MSVIINKLSQLEQGLEAMRETVESTRTSSEQRVHRVEKKLADLISRFEQFQVTTEMLLVESDSEAPKFSPLPSLQEPSEESPEYEVSSEGELKVHPKDRVAMEERGYTVIGTLSEDAKVYLKMRAL